MDFGWYDCCCDEKMKKTFKDNPTRRKELRDEKRLAETMKNRSEVAKLNHAHRSRTRILFVNIGLGDQKTAKNFWVSIPTELKIKDIRNRVEKAFGDLNGNTRPI